MDDRFYYSRQRERMLRKRESDLSDKIYGKGKKNMNIYSNVQKDNSKKIMLVIMAIIMTALILIEYHARIITGPPAPMQTNGMSEIDQIKQKIREAKTLQDAYTSARDAAAQARDWDKSAEQATKVEEQKALIKKLYDDLHEANMKEGENGESK